MSGSVVWASSLGFLAGVFLRSFTLVSWPVALFCVFVGLLAVLCFFFDRRTIVAVIGIACIASGMGVLRMDKARLVADPVLQEHLDAKVSLVGRVIAEPDERERSVRLRVDVSTLLVGSTSVPVDARVLVVAPLHTEVSYGDTVRAEGELRLPDVFDTGMGRVFNYPMFLAKDGIVYQLAFAQVESTGENQGRMLKKVALALKHGYLDGLGRALPEPAAGLAGGITVGDKRAIGGELSDVFQKVSLIHILVLSGYNMTVVINSAAHVLAFIPRVAQFAVSGVIVGLFILMTGGASSAVRAGSMALLATYARLTGRTFVALRVLAVVAFAMVLWNPYVLAFDPGFQLSILATLGLILFTDPIAQKLAFIPERFALREITASTIGTQIAVLPLLLYQNGLLSLVALPANVLTLIIVPFAMLFSFIAAIAGLLFGPFAVLPALPAYGLLSYILAVAQFFGALPFSAVMIPAFGVWVMVSVYACLGAAYLYIQKKNGEG